MTQRTDRIPSLKSLRLPLRFLPGLRSRLRVRSSDPTAFLGGAVAAGLGLGGMAVVVILLWISSPFPDNGIDGALRVAADLWLLAHGAGLLRDGTLSGVPAPVGVTPLLLTALPVWLLYRAGADTVAEGGPRRVAGTVGWLVAGYLAVGAGVVAYTSYGPLRCDALGALLRLPVVAAVAAGAGAWRKCGKPRFAWLRRADAVVKGAVAGTAVLLGGGALLTAGALLWHLGPVGDAFSQLSAGLAGRLAVFALALALIPNAIVWGAAYGLGPGFTIGAGSVVAPTGVSGYSVLPDFPLLAALPAPCPGTPLSWTALALPLLAGAAIGWFAADGGRRRVALTALYSALACGAALALLARYASGPLGTVGLVSFGPTWWLTGTLAFGWTAAIGVPTALALRRRRSGRRSLLATAGDSPAA